MRRGRERGRWEEYQMVSRIGAYMGYKAKQKDQSTSSIIMGGTIPKKGSTALLIVTPSLPSLSTHFTIIFELIR